jgi:hypothetical protein
MKCGRLQTASIWSWNPTGKKLGLYLKWKVKEVNSLFSKNGHITPLQKIYEKYQYGYGFGDFMLISNALKWA